MKKWIVIPIVILIMSVLILVGLVNYTKNSSGFVEPKYWALSIAIKDFNSIRDEDEPYAYTVKEVSYVGWKKETYYQIFEITIMDSNGEYETYLVGVEYNLDNRFITKMIRTMSIGLGDKNYKHRISKQNIVKITLEEINEK